MVLKVTNTLTGKKEVFEPLIPGLVRMYVCGPTPYDHTHIGHARAYIVFDLIRRYLELKGYRVFHVMNITDIDDKIIRRAKELNVPWEEVPRKYTEEFLDVIVKLNIKMPHVMPKVTE
ncbi:MAG: cysteine--tRNA ligase, partial [Thermoprotei archaeon]